jgi:hypothetical protein
MLTESHNEEQPTRRAKIMVVDDDPDLRQRSVCDCEPITLTQLMFATAIPPSPWHRRRSRT